MLTSKGWSNKIFTACQDPRGCVAIPFEVAKWLFVGCIIFSFLLVRTHISHLAQCLMQFSWHTRRARLRRSSPVATFPSPSQMSWPRTTIAFVCHGNPPINICHLLVVQGPTIIFVSSATSTIRQRRKMTLPSSSSSLSKVNSSTRYFCILSDPRPDWKRLLLADGPRQTINALTLYSFIISKSHEPGQWWFLPKYFNKDDMVTNGLLVTIIFTVTVFVCSLLLLIMAAILYIPLLCYIQGNLKEYCCHKVDKVRSFDSVYITGIEWLVYSVSPS